MISLLQPLFRPPSNHRISRIEGPHLHQHDQIDRHRPRPGPLISQPAPNTRTHLAANSWAKGGQLDELHDRVATSIQHKSLSLLPPASACQHSEGFRRISPQLQRICKITVDKIAPALQPCSTQQSDPACRTAPIPKPIPSLTGPSNQRQAPSLPSTVRQLRNHTANTTPSDGSASSAFGLLGKRLCLC